MCRISGEHAGRRARTAGRRRSSSRRLPPFDVRARSDGRLRAGESAAWGRTSASPSRGSHAPTRTTPSNARARLNIVLTTACASMGQCVHVHRPGAVDRDSSKAKVAELPAGVAGSSRRLGGGANVSVSGNAVTHQASRSLDVSPAYCWARLRLQFACEGEPRVSAYVTSRCVSVSAGWWSRWGAVSESLNSRMPRPSERPAAGSRLGPRTRSAMTRTTASSIGPMVGIGYQCRRGISRLARYFRPVQTLFAEPAGLRGRGEVSVGVSSSPESSCSMK